MELESLVQDRPLTPTHLNKCWQEMGVVNLDATSQQQLTPVDNKDINSPKESKPMRERERENRFLQKQRVQLRRRASKQVIKNRRSSDVFLEDPEKRERRRSGFEKWEANRIANLQRSGSPHEALSSNQQPSSPPELVPMEQFLGNILEHQNERPVENPFEIPHSICPVTFLSLLQTFALIPVPTLVDPTSDQRLLQLLSIVTEEQLQWNPSQSAFRLYNNTAQLVGSPAAVGPEARIFEGEYPGQQNQG